MFLGSLTFLVISNLNRILGKVKLILFLYNNFFPLLHFSNFCISCHGATENNVNNKDDMQDGKFSYAHDYLPIVQMLDLESCIMMWVFYWCWLHYLSKNNDGEVVFYEVCNWTCCDAFYKILWRCCNNTLQ